MSYTNLALAQQLYSTLGTYYADRCAQLRRVDIGLEERQIVTKRAVKLWHSVETLQIKMARYKERTPQLSPNAKEVCTGSFFRNNFEGLALDRFIAHIVASQQREVRVLSAGCFSGEEAFTWALILREALPQDISISVVGADSSPNGIGQALKAQEKPGFEFAFHDSAGNDSFSNDVPAKYQKYFSRAASGNYCLDQGITRLARFIMLDLAAFNPHTIGRFDLISCCNVLMHHSVYNAAQVCRRLEAALRDEHSLLVINTDRESEFPLTLRGRRQQTRLTEAFIGISRSIGFGRSFHQERTAQALYRQYEQHIEEMDPEIKAQIKQQLEIIFPGRKVAFAPLLTPGADIIMILNNLNIAAMGRYTEGRGYFPEILKGAYCLEDFIKILTPDEKIVMVFDHDKKTRKIYVRIEIEPTRTDPLIFYFTEKFTNSSNIT